MRTLACSLLLTTASTALAAPAFAETPAAPAPAFAIMDNTGAPSQLDTDLAFMVPTDDEEDGDGILLRMNLLGQYVAPGGFGGYAGIDVMQGLFDDSDDSYQAIGNLQLGGLFQRSLNPQVDIGARVGLILPTASDKGFDSLVHLIGTQVTRPADLATSAPDATWIRLGVSPTFHSGDVFLRTDAGIDVPVLDAENFKLDAIGHVNIGAGVRHDRLVATAELQSAFAIGSEDDVESLVHTGALSVRYHGATLAPFVALSSPLDDDLAGEIFAITVGLTAPL